MANDPEPSAADAIALTWRLMSLLPRLAMAMSQASYRQLREVTGQDYSLIDYQGVFAAGSRVGFAWWLEPLRALEAQTQLVCRSLILIGRQCRGDSGIAPSNPVGDKRFLDRAWQEDPVLRGAKELYLLYADWLMAQLRDCPALDKHDRQKLIFYTRQLLSALAPTNLALVNPKVRARARETNGESLINGLENMLHDLEAGKGLFPITQNDPHAFEVGRNLATTAGKIVYRNDLIELIQ